MVENILVPTPKLQMTSPGSVAAAPVLVEAAALLREEPGPIMTPLSLVAVLKPRVLASGCRVTPGAGTTMLWLGFQSWAIGATYNAAPPP